MKHFIALLIFAGFVVVITLGICEAANSGPVKPQAIPPVTFWHRPASKPDSIIIEDTAYLDDIQNDGSIKQRMIRRLAIQTGDSLFRINLDSLGDTIWARADRKLTPQETDSAGIYAVGKAMSTINMTQEIMIAQERMVLALIDSVGQFPDTTGGNDE